MEVGPKYKQTAIGVIPEDWEASSLQDACGEPITYGIVQCGPHVPNGVPYVRVSDMDSPELDVDLMLRTAPAIAARFSRSCVQEGDLIYALRGKLGEVRLVRSSTAGANLTQGTARLSPRNGVLNAYLLWAMRDPSVLRCAEVEAKGTTFREITLADLRRIPIRIPPLHEQHTIANALDDVEALLANLDRAIAKKRDLKQAVMQRLLTGQTRLPGFQGQWKLSSLDSLVTRRPGFWGQDSADSTHPHAVQVIRAGDVSPQGKLTGSARRFFTATEYEKAVCKVDDVVITASGSVGKVWLCDGRIDFSASNFVRLLRPIHGRVDGAFLYQLLLSRAAQNLMREHTAVGVMANLGPSFFSSPWARFPEIDEQRAIASLLSDMDAEIAALEARRDKTRALKQGMMQELLTGRTRLI